MKNKTLPFLTGVSITLLVVGAIYQLPELVSTSTFTAIAVLFALVLG